MGDLLASMPERIRRWIEPRGECWIDRHHELDGRFASIAIDGDPTRCVVMRRAVLEQIGAKVRPRVQYRATCGHPSCVNPEHLSPRTSRREIVQNGRNAWNLRRISYTTNEQRDQIVAVLRARGFIECPARRGGQHRFARVNEFRVLSKIRRVEYRVPARSNVHPRRKHKP